MMNRDEIRVKELFEKRGCLVTPIDQKDNILQKPDFIVENKDLKFLCEVKSIQGDSALNNISSKIHESAKQFRSVELSLPNVLVFCNHHDNEWINSLDLRAVLTGNFYSENGERSKIYATYSDGRIKEEKYDIALYIWLTKDDRIVCIFTNEEGQRIMDRLFSINKVGIA